MTCEYCRKPIVDEMPVLDFGDHYHLDCWGLYRKEEVMRKTALVISLKCPACQKPTTTFHEVIFIEGYHVQFLFRCCGKELQSEMFPVLSLFPDEHTHETTN